MALARTTTLYHRILTCYSELALVLVFAGRLLNTRTRFLQGATWRRAKKTKSKENFNLKL